MTRGPKSLCAITLHIRPFAKLIQNGEHPFTVFEEQVFPENIHITKTGNTALCKLVGSIAVLRIFLINNLKHQIIIFHMKFRCILVMLPGRRIMLRHVPEVFPLCHDDIILFNQLPDPVVIEAILLSCLVIQIRFQNIPI